MESLKLLIIEDEDSQLLLYRDTIDHYNKNSDLKIEPSYFKSFLEGSDALLKPYYDGAIIDLKLSSKPDLEGVDLVERVYKKIRIPLFVVSGSISQIEHLHENALFKKRDRTGDLSNVIKDIVEIYNTGITGFLKPNGLLDQKLTSIFWDNLSVDINKWIEHKNPKNLLRYIFSHVQEYLDINIDGDFEEYHPNEFYIKPPIKRNIHTGDLILLDGQYYVVLTPACDIVFNYKRNETGVPVAFRKSENMLVARVEIFDAKKTCLNKEGKIDKSKISQFIKNEGYRFHYLPPVESNKGFLVDFQTLSNISYESKFERVASISAPFIKDIISRFSAYYSRQGQPTFGQNAIIENIFTSEKKLNEQAQ